MMPLPGIGFAGVALAFGLTLLTMAYAIGHIGHKSKLINRRTRAVASYFEQRGISANRLILLGSSSAPHTSAQGADNVQSLKQNFEVVQLDLASGLD